MGYRMSKCLFVTYASLFHFSPYFLLFGKHPIPPSSIVVQMEQVVDLDSLATWVRVIIKKLTLFRRVMPMAMDNFYKPKVRQFDVGDFVYFQWQFNDTLNTSSNHTILRIKVIKPSSVLELQGANKRTIQDHSKNYAPCHLPNLDPTIITSTWIPPLDYPCEMLLCDNCNGGYHLFCLKPEFIQVSADLWYCSSCFPTTP
ncbi:hypothetical protein CY35_03G010900 [Sphagnum magellanicum]|nr:hypothetical protein CY35_03G010900 [Sphagnum magellanicum]